MRIGHASCVECLLHELEYLELTDFAQSICAHSLFTRLAMHAWMSSYNRVSVTELCSSPVKISCKYITSCRHTAVNDTRGVLSLFPPTFITNELSTISFFSVQSFLFVHIRFRLIIIKEKFFPAGVERSMPDSKNKYAQQGKFLYARKTNSVSMD